MVFQVSISYLKYVTSGDISILSECISVNTISVDAGRKWLPQYVLHKKYVTDFDQSEERKEKVLYNVQSHKFVIKYE